MISFIKDIFAPKKCYFCNKQWHFFCLECEKNIPRIPSICYVCKQKNPWFTIHEHCREYLDVGSLIVLFWYRDIKKLIKDSKYYAKKDILEDLGYYMWQSLLRHINKNNPQDYIILSVPMNFWRKSKRWYNHADILTKHVSKSSGILYSTKVLKRVKNTLQQSKLTKNQRLSNLNWAFVVNPKIKHLLIGKHVIIVDDVVSTWVTFSEIVSIIDKTQVKSICCAAIASDTQIFD